MARGAPALSLLALLIASACGAPPGTPQVPPPPTPAPAPEDDEEEPPDPPGLPYPAPDDDPDFPAKEPSRPGDWLATFPEAGQSAAEHRAECRNRATPQRRTIVIQPLGRLSEGRGPLLEQVRAFAEAWFGLDARIAQPLDPPRSTWNPDRRQHDGDAILRHLENRVPPGALAFVGLCEEDLWSGRLNFVFGVASLRSRTGLYSLARYGGGGDALFLRRTLKVFAHETGHILGMEHCVRYECVMNGSNSLGETDRQPSFACPECHEKLRWNGGFDPRARWAALAGFYESVGLAEEAAFARRRAER